MTRGPRRAPAERATIDSMEHVRTGVQRRTLIGAGVAMLAFGGVLGAFVASDDSSSGRQEISDTAETTTTTEAPTTTAPTSTTVEVTTTMAPASTGAPASPTTAAPQPLEQKVAEHEERISDLEEEVAPPPSTTTTAAPLDPCALLPQGSDARAACESG